MGIRGKRQGNGSTSDTYLTRAYLLIFGLLFLMSYKYIASVALGKQFERTYIARDTALLISTMQASPGELEYTYPTNLSALKIRINISLGNVSADEGNNIASLYYFPMMNEQYLQESVFETNISLKKNSTGIYKE